jgi:hypothetical protein
LLQKKEESKLLEKERSAKLINMYRKAMEGAYPASELPRHAQGCFASAPENTNPHLSSYHRECVTVRTVCEQPRLENSAVDARVKVRIQEDEDNDRAERQQQLQYVSKERSRVARLEERLHMVLFGLFSYTLKLT